jgi:hypothetical protein
MLDNQFNAVIVLLIGKTENIFIFILFFTFLMMQYELYIPLIQNRTFLEVFDN